MVDFNKLFHVKSGGDKIAHFIAGFITAILTFAFVSTGIFDLELYKFSSSVGIVTATAIVVVGVGKELVDKYIRKTFFDFFDMFATILGGWIGIFAIGLYFTFF